MIQQTQYGREEEIANMKTYCPYDKVLLLLLLLGASWAETPTPTPTGTPQPSTVTIPPLIVEEPDKMIAFREYESIELPCVATGEPYPTYYWEMNNEYFDPSGNDGRIAIQPGVGTLIFARPLERDQAIYQCFATNQVGTALTVKVDLRIAILEPFPPDSVKNHYPQRGHPATLRCVPPRSFPKADIFWATVVDNDRFIPVDLTDRVTMDPEGNLHFVHVKEEDHQDGRTYSCIVQNTVMRSIQHGAYARIYPQGEDEVQMSPSILWQSPTHQIALRGDTLRIKCIFSGNPTPRVNWDRLEGDMPSRYREESFGQELVIEDVQFEDVGKYECQGINDQAQTPIRRSFDLQVEAAPYWVQRPESVDAAENEKVEFHCEAYGIPDPVNYWFLDGIPITNVDADPRREVEQNKVTFNNVTKDDAQVLQCNATNKHGYIFANAYLNVLSEPPIILEPPLEEQRAAEGQTTVLQCLVFGSPKPLVVWRKGSEQLTGGRFKVLDDGHLEITDVSLVDAGSYTCTASNKFDTVSASGGLLVRRKTQIQTAPQDVMIYEYTEAKFTCTATTDPEEVLNMTVNWKKDGEFINYQLAQRMFKNDMDNSLTITGAISLDTAKYTCVANNGLDEDEASAQLTVQGVPDPPTNVRVECHKIGDDVTEVTWQPGRENYAPILNYILQYNTTFTPDTWVDIANNISQNVGSYQLTLSPYSNYTFRVLARNKIGMSSPSLPTEGCQEIVEANPTTNPKNVIGEGDEPGNLVIFWTPMPKIEQNGKEFYYFVSWESHEKGTNGDPEVSGSQRITIPTAWHYVVPDDPRIGIYKPFDVSVKCGNSAGDSEASEESVVGYSGEAEPDVAPDDVEVIPESVQSTTAVLTFTHVSTEPDDVHGYFQGYRIQFARENEWPDSIREQDWLIGEPVKYPRPRPRARRQIEAKQADDVPESGSPINVPVRHLPADSDVRLHVRVLNKYYVGPPSNTIIFHTEEGVPGPPLLFDVISRGSTHFDLSWDKPYETNGELIGYNISYQTITDLNLGRLQYRPPILDPEKTYDRLTGLIPDTFYRVYLSAATIVGKGEPNFLDDKTMPSGPPNPPTFSIVALNDTWANITWVPSRTGSPGSVFYVQYRPRGWYEWWSSADEAMKSFIYIYDLDPGTTYQCRVVAKNGEGYETAAEWQEFHTTGTAPGRYVLAESWWFWGIWISLFIIAIGIVVFFLLKRLTDRWFDRKEEEIQDQLRQLQAEEAARQLGVFNEYANTGSQEMLADPSFGTDYKGGPPVFDDEEYSDDDYDEEDDGDIAPVTQGSLAAPDVGFHPAQAFARKPSYDAQPPEYNGKEAPPVDPNEAVRAPTPTGSAHVVGGQYVLDPKNDGRDTFA